MDYKQKETIKKLTKFGEELLNKPIDFFENAKKIEKEEKSEANNLLKNIKKFPHAFVLACIMDRQIKDEKAWLVPYKIKKEIGSFDFKKLAKLKQEEIETIFRKEKLVRYWKDMAEYFYRAVQKIKEDYNGDASKIWENNPTSCAIVGKFLEFDGVGRKIATMAANILARDFKIKMKNLHCIDVSPDRQVKRVFERISLVSKDASDDKLMYCTRELNPKYPGIFDLPAWKIGRDYCHPQNPDCSKCILNEYCSQKI